MASATLWVENGSIKIRTQGDWDAIQAFNAALKKRIQFPNLRWNAKAKGGDNTWIVDPSVIQKVREAAIAAEVELNVIGLDDGPPQPSSDMDAYRQMFIHVPLEQLRKVYLALVRAYHPDAHPGDEETYNGILSDINAGWARVQEEKSRDV